MAARKSSSTTSCCASCGPGEKGPRLIALYVLTSLLLLVSLLSLFAEIGLGGAGILVANEANNCTDSDPKTTCTVFEEIDDALVIPGEPLFNCTTQDPDGVNATTNGTSSDGDSNSMTNNDNGAFNCTMSLGGDSEVGSVGDANVSAYLPEPTPESSDVFLYWMIGSSGCGVLSALLSTLLFVAFVAMIREEEKERNRERKKKTKKKKQEEVAAHSAAHNDGEGVGAGGGKTPVASEGLPNSSSSLQLTHSNAASQLGSTSVTDQQSDAQRERKDRESHATTSESFELKAEEEEGEGGGREGGGTSSSLSPWRCA